LCWGIEKHPCCNIIDSNICYQARFLGPHSVRKAVDKHVSHRLERYIIGCRIPRSSNFQWPVNIQFDHPKRRVEDHKLIWKWAGLHCLQWGRRHLGDWISRSQSV
jgi:hypothetical protein